MSVGGSLIDDSAPLAQIESTEEINWKDGLADTRILVSVQKCPNKFRSRLGYHANLYITLPDGVERDIGYIKAWRISRPSGVNPTIDPQWCLGDWYFKPLETYDEGARQMAYCVRALYGKGELPARRLSDRFVNEKKKDEIRDGGNELVFIETIYIKWREDPGDPQTEVCNCDQPSFTTILIHANVVYWIQPRSNIPRNVLQTVGWQSTTRLVLPDGTGHLFIIAPSSSRVPGIRIFSCISGKDGVH